MYHKVKSNQFNHNGLFINQMVFDEKNETNILFVHGGPGSHSHYFESFAENNEFFQNAPINWLTYDQRGCGRSEIREKALTHQQNIKDLGDVITFCSSEIGKVHSVFAHSYGSWLSYDYFKQCEDTTPLIWAGISENANIPKNKSLLMDLILLKIFQSEDYQDLLEDIEFNEYDAWKAAKKVRQATNQFEKRKYFYWANLSVMAIYEELKKKSPYQDKDDVFRQIRKDLYSSKKATNEPNPEKISNDVLWINGFHDYLMSGEQTNLGEIEQVKLYSRSGHYPHFEESERFVNDVIQFLKID